MRNALIMESGLAATGQEPGETSEEAPAQASAEGQPEASSSESFNEGELPRLPSRATLSEIADDAAEDMGLQTGLRVARTSRDDNKIHLTLNPASIAESAQVSVFSRFFCRVCV
jgi:hypothetical protein